MLDKALSLASALPYKKGQQRVGAIATDKRGRVLAERTNSYTKSHPLQKAYSLKASENEHKHYLHAEVATIIAAQRLNGGKIHRLYVARSSKKGQHLPSKPCKVCAMAIKEAGVEGVIYHK